MRRFLFPFILISALLFLYFFHSSTPPSPLLPSLPSPIPAPSLPDTSHQLSLYGKNYRYYFYQIPPTATIEIIPNFSEKENFNTLVSGRCDFAINGGLYTPEEKPVGLFFHNQKLISPLANSQTFNGFFVELPASQYDIVPKANFNNSLLPYLSTFQAGPYFDFSASTPTTFLNHQYDRRHLIVKDTQGQLYFFSLSLADQAFSGPRLEDIQAFFTTPEIKKIATFTSALNLDGGTASAFYDGVYFVDELSPVGSVLCGHL